MKLIETEWARYRQEIISSQEGPAQLREKRKAFYRGAAALLQTLLTGLAPGGEATAGDLELFGALEAELRAELGKEA